MLLLTLLPMTIWAATDLSVAKLSVRNQIYGVEALNATVQTNAADGDFRTSWDRDLVLDTDFTWNGKIYSDQACTTEVTNLATAPVGYYYVKFVGVGFFEGEVVCPFQILKRKLYVSVKGDVTPTYVSDVFAGYTGEWISTTYGVPFDLDDIEGVEDVEGLVNNEEFDDVVKGEITAITTEETDANASPANVVRGFIPFYTGEQPGDYVDGYVATLVGLTSDNYEIVCVNPLYIVQKDISDGEGLTFSLPVNSATYNGQVQEPEYKITYGNAVLVQGEEGDFTVSYPGYENGFAGPKDVLMSNNEVGAYKTQINGQGNFTGTYPATTAEEYGEDPFLWTIEPVGLTIITLDQTKVYDGTANLPLEGRDKAFNVLLPYGVEVEAGEIEEFIGNVKISVKDASPDVKWNGNTVGSYEIQAKVKDADGNDYQNDNYDYNIQNAGKFTITPRGLTITASDATKKVTVETDPTFSVANPEGYEFEITEEEEEKGETFVNNLKTTLRQDITGGRYTFIKGSYNQNNYAGANLNVTRQNASTDTGVGEYKTLKVNYTNQGKIKNYTVTTVNGTFTITGGKIYITALAQSKNYGEDDPDWKNPVMGTDYRLDVENQPNLTNKVTVEGIVLTRVEGETPGTYTISASGAVLPAGYDKIVYANGPFTINKRPININIANQTFKVGDKVFYSFDKEAYTIDNEDPTEGLAPKDNASDLFQLKLVRGVEGNEEQMDVTPRNALYKFESYSAEEEEEGWLMAHGVVEVTGQIPGQFATVVVRRNIADNATTGGQANAFKDKTFYVENTNTDGLKKLYDIVTYDPVDGEFELAQSPLVEGVWVKIGQEVRSAVESNNAVYVFESFSKESDEEPEDAQYGAGAVELLGYDEESGLSEIVVKQNFAVSPVSQEEAAVFVGQHFYVEGNPADGIPESRLQLIAQAPNPEYDADAAADAEEAGEDYNVPQYTAGLAQQIWVEIVACVKEATEAVESVDGVKTADADKLKKEYFILGENEIYGEYTSGIVLDYTDDFAKNYDFDPTAAGTVWVIPEDALVLDRDDADLAAKIEAANGENKFIAFKGITLKAGRWNTLVLPFDTSVEELSNEFGYSVVDMLDETNTNANTITISLAFGDIPANTPFLIQPKEDVVLSDGFCFFDTPVVYSENPVAEDGANHKLVGTYTGVSIEANSADKYVYQPSAKEFRHPGANGANLKPLMAYLQDETGAATRIFIQEPDGENTVTAIGEIAAEVENEAQATDGWYSVSGMKLNAAPTQKGIFIKDGKKFLIAK